MRGYLEPAVLVIEPDAMLGQVLSKVLTCPGLTVVHAVNVTQALHLAEQHAPRVVLLDCGHRSGLELAVDLRSRYAGLLVTLMGADACKPEALPGARRSVSALKTWGISEEDIQAVREEAENVIKRQGKHDPKKDAFWAQVEIKALGAGDRRGAGAVSRRLRGGG